MFLKLVTVLGVGFFEQLGSCKIIVGELVCYELGNLPLLLSCSTFPVSLFNLFKLCSHLFSIIVS